MLGECGPLRRSGSLSQSDDRCAVPEVSGRWRAAVLTVSDSGARGERQDTSGDWLVGQLAELPADVVLRHLLPDEPELVSRWLIETQTQLSPALIVCTGGTGLHPRDRTPQAVLAVGDYPVPGMSEAMRAAGMTHTPHAMLSRQAAVVRGQTLILAVPGAPKAVRESLEAVWAALPHALEMVAGLPRASTTEAHAGR